jgi:endonuclease V-like protein UPF0215 family
MEKLIFLTVLGVGFFAIVDAKKDDKTKANRPVVMVC